MKHEDINLIEELLGLQSYIEIQGTENKNILKNTITPEISQNFCFNLLDKIQENIK